MDGNLPLSLFDTNRQCVILRTDTLHQSLQLGASLRVYYPEIGLHHYGIVYEMESVGLYTRIAVVHNSKSGGGVCKIDFGKFANGQSVEIADLPSSDPHQKDILKRMNLAMDGAAQYRAAVQNCEHFVTWCYTGIPASPTADKAWVIAGVVGCVALAVAIPSED